MKNKKTPGQVVVIITIFIAVMILFSLVLINIFKVSDLKTTTSQIADQGALSLGSQLGGYVKVLNDKIAKRVWFLAAFGSTCAPNWGLYLIVAGIITAIVMWPLAVGGSMVGTLLAMSGVAISSGAVVTLMDINGAQRRAFADSVYSMTSYTAFRESVILSMLGSIQGDTAAVTQTGGLTSPRFTDNNPGPSQKTVYDLTGSPGLPQILELVKQNKPVSRYLAWYYSNRLPRISEKVILDPPIENLINVINLNTKIELWDPDLWEIQKLTFKTRPMIVTKNSEKWVVKGTNEIRVVGPVQLNDWAVNYCGVAGILNFIWGEGGFLINKFRTLTERLLDANYSITYSTKGSQTFCNVPLPWGYDHKEIYQVNDDIRGFLTRAMELLNLPVSYRIAAMSNWLPAFYNETDASPRADIYKRLMDDQALISKWLRELKAINSIITPIILQPNGHCPEGGDEAGRCDKSCGSCSGCCCSDPGPCTYWGTYCRCTPDLRQELCTHGDLYGNKPSLCPPGPKDTYCACGGCSQVYPVVIACRFQGDLNWAPSRSSQTEVLQAIDILTDMNRALKDITDAIYSPDPKVLNLVTEARNVMVTTQIKEQATYGWVDKNNTPHVVSVRVDGYPPYQNFPSIVESELVPFGLIKCWNVRGTVEGWIKTTVSSYAGDVPAGWWILRTRRSVNQPEFSRTDLNDLIAEIHAKSNDRYLQLKTHKVDFDALMANYAIRSAANGHWGADKKNQIYIQRTSP